MNRELLKQKLETKDFCHYSNDEIIQILSYRAHKDPKLELTICIEEVAELIQEVSKLQRGRITKDDIGLKEEIADVLICIKNINILSHRSIVNVDNYSAIVKNTSFSNENVFRLLQKLQYKVFTFYNNFIENHNTDIFEYSDITTMYDLLFAIIKKLYIDDFSKDIRNIIDIKIDKYNEELNIVDKVNFEKLSIEDLLEINDNTYTELAISRFNLIKTFIRQDYCISLVGYTSLDTEDDKLLYRNYINLIHWYIRNGYFYDDKNKEKHKFIEHLTIDDRDSLVYSYVALYELYENILKYTDRGRM